MLAVAVTIKGPSIHGMGVLAHRQAWAPKNASSNVPNHCGMGIFKGRAKGMARLGSRRC